MYPNRTLIVKRLPGKQPRRAHLSILKPHFIARGGLWNSYPYDVDREHGGWLNAQYMPAKQVRAVWPSRLALLRIYGELNRDAHVRAAISF